MSTDSSDSEDAERFREAVDGNFLTEDLFKNGISEKQKDSPKQLPSLRNQNNKIESVNPFSIKVTPEFQKYVSQHLSKMLDEIIEEQETPMTKKRKKKHKDLNSDSGVKLLNKSKNFLDTAISEISNLKNFNCRKKNDSDSDFEEKAKEVAVTPDWILSKKETESWAPTKGEVEVVVLNGFNQSGNKSKKKKKKKKNKSAEIA